VSLYKDASLVMIPSAYKDGKLYSIRPTDGSGDFTFSRGSNLAATRVDVNGLIEKGRENLLLQSNQFDTTWSFSNTTSRVGGQAGYDGTNDAWLWTAATGTFTRMNQTPTLSGVITGSIYVKAANTHFVAIQPFGANEAYVKFNLSTGAVHETYGNLIDYKIESVGNDWYRCSVTASSSSSQVSIYLLDSAGNFANTNTDSIYIQDAQLEAGLVATDYIETGASTAQAGILEDMPRLDYSGGASCPALLLEPQRTNQVQNSEYYESYALNSVSISSNATTSPEGLQNASELVEDSSNDNHFFRIPNLSWTSGTDVVFSIYLKENTRRYARLRFDNTGGNTRAWLDLRTGEVTYLDPTDDAVCTSTDVGNGWFRYELKVTPSNTGTGSVQIFTQSEESVTGSLQTIYQGDGSSGIYVYGAQVETASYPTSYIPTYGSSVTRSLDFATKTGLTSLINSTQGTMFLDFKALANNLPSEYSYFSMSDGTYSNRISILQSIGSTNRVRAFGFVGGTKVFDFNNSVTDITTQTKVAVRYANNAFDLFVNGAKVATDTSGSIFPSDTLDRVSFSEIGTTTSAFKGQVNQTAIFPTALTDSECIALTTL
jgi:hypothetical protein